MAVVIRLQRHGTTKQLHWRVVATDSAMPRDGRFIEQLGYYDPHRDPAKIQFNEERLSYWLGVGAKPTVAVKNLIRRAKVQVGKGK